MPDTVTEKAVLVPLPTDLIRAAKADAAERGVSLKVWWAEAGRLKLSQTKQAPKGTE